MPQGYHSRPKVVVGGHKGLDCRHVNANVSQAWAVIGCLADDKLLGRKGLVRDPHAGDLINYRQASRRAEMKILVT